MSLLLNGVPILLKLVQTLYHVPELDFAHFLIRLVRAQGRFTCFSLRRFTEPSRAFGVSSICSRTFGSKYLETHRPYMYKVELRTH